MSEPQPPAATGHAAPQRGAAPPPPSGGSGSPGLVSLATSRTLEGSFSVSRSDLRHSRIARTVVEGCGEIVEDLARRGVRYRCAMVTLTYAPGHAPAPRDITRATDAMDAWCRRRGCWMRYCWRFEFGETSGRPHYHLLVFLPPRLRLPLFDKRGWWTHGMTNAVWARNPVRYIAKYCSKASCGAQDWNVKGMRWSGAGGMTAAMRLAVRWRVAPAWLREFRDRIEGDALTALRRAGSRWLVGPWRLRSPWTCRELPGHVLEFFWRGFTEGSVEYVA
jgi:hypothetical protein